MEGADEAKEFQILVGRKEMESDSESLCNCEARESRGSSEGKRTRQPRDPRCKQRRGFRMMDRWVSAVQRSHSHFTKPFASITRPVYR